MHRVMSSWCVQSQESSMVPFVGAVLDTARTPDQTALQTALSCVVRKLANGLYASFPYQTPQGQISPPKRSRTKIRANALQNQNEKHPLPLPTHGSLSPFYTNICFLHACTPARLHAVRLHAVHPQDACTGTPVQANEHTVRDNEHKTYPSKNVQVAETVGKRDQSGGASKPHRSKYMSLHDCFLFLIS